MPIDAATPEAGSALAETIAESLMPGRRDALRRLFNDHGARAPMVIWSPTLAELQSPLLRRFALHCEALMDDAGRVPDAAFSADDLEGLSDWLMVLSLDEGTFRYDFYGRAIADHYGRDMTGETTRAFGGHISTFFEGLYAAALRRREWAMSEHEPPHGVFVRAWRRLIVPLFAQDGETVARFAVLNIPENELRAGLELMPDPVFVADADQRVQYANAAAARMFELDRPRAPGATLMSLTGISLDDQQSPDALLTGQEVTDSVQLTLKGGIAERLIMTVSAAEHRGRAFYVVVMRLIQT